MHETSNLELGLATAIVESRKYLELKTASHLCAHGLNQAIFGLGLQLVGVKCTQSLSSQFLENEFLLDQQVDFGHLKPVHLLLPCFEELS